MKKCIITAETTCDLSKELIEKHGFKLIPITIILNDKEYKDAINITSEELFEYVASSGKLPKTAALSVGEYEDFFAEVKKECETIIHFSISSKASSTIENARKAAENIGNVYVIDTKALSTGEALLMLKASDMLEEGAEPQAVYDEICKTADKVQTSFVLDTLDNMHKGGRCSSAALFGSKLLKIHPFIYENDGALSVKKKYMGTLSRSLLSYVSDLRDENPSYDARRVFITHSPCDGRENIELVINKVKELFDFEEIIETQAGATVSTHCGKNTIGVLFINK